MQDKLIQLCGLYENISKATGKKYLVGNLSFTSKVLIFQNDNAKEGEPGRTLFLAEKAPKPQAPHFSGTPGDDSQTRQLFLPYRGSSSYPTAAALPTAAGGLFYLYSQIVSLV